MRLFNDILFKITNKEDGEGKLIKQISKRQYLLIVLFAGLLYYISYNYMHSQNEYAKILNVSGKQRMLSQMLVILSETFYDKKTPKSKKEFQDALYEIEHAHLYLRSKIFTPELRSIYFKQGLDKNIKAYLLNFHNFIKTNDEKYIITARDASKNILVQLDNSVKEYERYINEQIKNVDTYKDIMIGGFLLTIIILLYLFIELRNQLKSNSILSQELQKNIDIISKYVIFSKTDLKGIITEASDAFSDISKYSKDELVGKPHNIIRHVDMSSSAFRDMWDTIQSGKVWKGEVKNLKKDGSHYWVVANISPEYDEAGNINGYMAIRYDITARKDFEKQHVKLMQSEKLASMGEMIGNIAHQWRQPLSVISTSASGVKVKNEFNMLEDDDIQTYMNSIIENTQFLSKTIDTFRDFIKDDKTYKNVIIQDEISQALNIVSVSLKNKFIAIKDNIDYENKINISMITGELQQVLINILNNAKDILLEKDTDNTWVKLELKKTNSKAIITVEDNGGGISDNILPKIFDPYFTTKHQSQGTGLGLHMSYQIITDSLKGKLYVENTNNGAKFFIELPLY